MQAFAKVTDPVRPVHSTKTFGITQIPVLAFAGRDQCDLVAVIPIGQASDSDVGFRQKASARMTRLTAPKT